jgi:hypothetical protein
MMKPFLGAAQSTKGQNYKPESKSAYCSNEVGFFSLFLHRKTKFDMQK